MTPELWQEIKHFKPAEFDSPDAPGSSSKMDPALMALMDKLRERMKRPMKINSGFRTSQHNIEVGGVTNSPHLTGHAADIHVPDSSFRFWLVIWSVVYGIRRLGIGKHFIHIDNHPDKPKNLIWVY